MKQKKASEQAASTFVSRQKNSKKNVVQQVAFKDNRPEAIEQKSLHQAINDGDHMTIQRKEASQSIPQKNNQTGLPDQLKAGIENLSGHSMDDVKVHCNSDKPTQLQAHAYAQGTDIHLAQGQEKHLPHEAWHVAQQKQGRVKPTMSPKSKVNVNDDAGLEKEADVMGAKALHMQTVAEFPGTKTSKQSQFLPTQLVLQGQWIKEKNTGKNLNLKKTDDPDIFILSATNTRYRVTQWDTYGNPTEVQAESGYHANYKYDTWDVYQDWTKKSSGISMDSEFGKVSAFHNRGAPKIGSKKSDYGNVSMGDTYVEYVRGLRSGSQDDEDIAQALLEMDDSTLSSNLEKRAAAMLHTTVYLAEEWRKQGAAKIYRAYLRTIVDGDKTFDDFLNEFQFIPSAKEGRLMVGRFKDVYNSDANLSDLNANEEMIYGNVSDMDDDDFSSDDDMKDEKKLAGTRDYSKGNKGEKGWTNPWK